MAKPPFILTRVVSVRPISVGMLMPRKVSVLKIKCRAIGIPQRLWLQHVSVGVSQHLCFSRGVVIRLLSTRGFRRCYVHCLMIAMFWLWIMRRSIKVQRQRRWSGLRVRVYCFYRPIPRSWIPLSRISPTSSGYVNTMLRLLLMIL